MSQPDIPLTSRAPVTVIDYWRVIWAARWLILGMVLVGAGVAFAIANGQPKVYAAKATILQPKETVGTGLSGSLGMLLGSGASGGQGGGGLLSSPGASLGVGSTSPNQEIFIALLNSRTLREEVLAEASKRWTQAVGGMLVSVSVDSKDKGVIGLTVEAKDPQLAAEMANLYFSQLDVSLDAFADRATKRKETLYAAQLERAAKEVEAAEQGLLKFQAANRFVAIDAPTKAAAGEGGSLRGTIMAFEMQRELLRMRFTEEHPQMRELQRQIAELKKQYSKNLFGQAMDLPPEDPKIGGFRKEFFVATANMTPVQFAFLKLLRNLKIQEAYYTGAVQGLQQIKYGEGRYQFGVEVLDPAVPPSRPSRPNVPLVVTVAVVSATIAGALIALILEYLRRVRELDRLARRTPSPRTERSENGPEASRAPGLVGARSVKREGIPAGPGVRAGREARE